MPPTFPQRSLLACERWEQQNSEKLTYNADLPSCLKFPEYIIEQFLFKKRLFRVLCVGIIKLPVTHMIKRLIDFDFIMLLDFDLFRDQRRYLVIL